MVQNQNVETKLLVKTEELGNLNRGNSIAIIGDKKTGKTQVATKAIRALLMAKKNVLVISDEHALVHYLTNSFTDADEFLDAAVINATCGELHYSNGLLLSNYDNLEKQVKADKIDAVIVDTVTLGMHPNKQNLINLTTLKELSRNNDIFSAYTILEPKPHYSLQSLQSIEANTDTMFQVLNPSEVLSFSVL
jgi:archaellum biogenesis ATPase FlaH